ncbi:MAG TPA: HAMP domain-containing sensor histidine kinase [Mycobacteriales bacterium]|nr:HAMP domain-containing sensor histidine kinase [Mycobacteriales bacterium]
MKPPLRMARLRTVAAATPLRVKLIVTLLVVAAAGLAIAATVTTTALRSYLVNRVDQQLSRIAGPVIGRLPPDFLPKDRAVGDGQRGGTFIGGPTTGVSQKGGGGKAKRIRGQLPSPFYVVAFSSSGVPGPPESAPLSAQSPPKLPTLTASQARAIAGRPFTVSSVSGGSSWRAVVEPQSDGTGSVVVATSLADTNRTVGHVIDIEVLVGVAALLLMGGIGFLLIRRSLRPLAAVEHTAAAIASGDLTQRVPEAEPRTEVGRLAAALNAMLGQIERAFAHERSSQQQARASEEQMRRFVADASHELRTPLTSIRGFAELHRLGAAPDNTDEVMRRIEAEAARMGLLVDDLLLLARLDQQRPLEQVPVDLTALAAEAVDEARRRAPGRPISFESGAGAISVTGDASRLRQVLDNLLTNALVHTPDGTPVTVRLSSYDDPEPRAVIEVSDTGPGIPAEHAAHIFERFYRLDDARTRTSGGAGLGLSIVAGIVAVHGGTVTLDQPAAGGTTFRVELPRQEPEAMSS